MGHRTLRRGLRPVANNRIEMEASSPLCMETSPANIHTPCRGRGALTGGHGGVVSTHDTQTLSSSKW